MNKQNLLENDVSELLRKLEFKEGDLISYEEFTQRLHILAQLEKKDDFFVAHMHDLIESSDRITRFFKIGEKGSG